MNHLTEIFPQTDSLLLAFLNNSPAIAWLKDASGRHVFLSEPYLKEIGVPCEDWFGKSDFDFWPKPIAVRFLEDDQKVLQSGEILAFEDCENVTFPGGGQRVWWVVKFPFWDSRGQGFVGGMAVDITDRKNAERERQALEKEISDIAEQEQRRIAQDLHDGIGQELTAHALFASSLVQKIDAAVAANMIDPDVGGDILSLATKLSTGISESNKHLRSISRGMFPVHLDADRLMTTLSELAAITDELPGLCCSIQGKIPEKSFNGEVATHLFRIVQEAVNNSVKHGNCNEINIDLGNQGDDILLSVSDDGCGIRTRNDETSIRNGMGLRIMEYRARLINASLTVESPTEGGAIVRCIIKRQQ